MSTGAQSLMLGLPEEAKLLGHGLSTCATCDGFFFRDHDIAVVGGGDSAVEEALFLTKFAKTVTLVHRRDELRASKIMQERAFANDKIRFVWNSTVVGITGEQTVESITLEDTVTGEERELPVTGVFVAIGHKPNTDLFKGQLAAGGQRLPGHPRRAPTPTSRACSPAVTCRTTSTARPSPPPAPAAWPPSTPSAGSRRRPNTRDPGASAPSRDRAVVPSPADHPNR